MEREMTIGENHWSQCVSFLAYSKLNESTQRNIAKSNTYFKWRAIM